MPIDSPISTVTYLVLYLFVSKAWTSLQELLATWSEVAAHDSQYIAGIELLLVEPVKAVFVEAYYVPPLLVGATR